MRIISDLVESFLQDESFRRQLIARAICRRLGTIGFRLPADFASVVESKLSESRYSRFVLQLSDDFAPEHLLNSEDGPRPPIIRINAGDIDSALEAVLDEFSEGFVRLIPQMTHEMSLTILEDIRRRARSYLKLTRKDMKQFRSFVVYVWGEALDVLETLIAVCLQAGDDTVAECKQEAPEDIVPVLDVLLRLQARSCQVASEVVTLLGNGFADGAHARWRCMHEMAVTGIFVAREGRDCAERYMQHDGIGRFKTAKLYCRHCDALGLEPLTKEHLGSIVDAKNDLLRRFGSEFGHDYGWAAAALGKKRPSFSDIEERVGLDLLRPYYKMASDNVHANARGVCFRLGALPGQHDTLLPRPSAIGLADPGYECAVSLSQMTITLLRAAPNMDRLVMIDVVRALEEDVGNAFIRAHRKSEEEVQRET